MTHEEGGGEGSGYMTNVMSIPFENRFQALSESNLHTTISYSLNVTARFVELAGSLESAGLGSALAGLGWSDG